MKSPFKFKQYGQSRRVGLREVPERRQARRRHRVHQVAATPSRTTTCRPCIRSTPASPGPGFPSAGAWITYGLGSENQNLPGYVVLGNTQGVKGGPLNWGAGFLPTTYQGTLFRSEGNPILNLQRPKDVDARRPAGPARPAGQAERRAPAAAPRARPTCSARIESFELAYRMQTEAADLVDSRKESAATRALYGLDNPKRPARSAPSA